MLLNSILLLLIYSLLFTSVIVWNSKNKEMWHHGRRVNRIDMLVLSSRCQFFHGSSSGGNREVKRAEAGVVWWWVTECEVWPRVQFDLILSVLRVKNVRLKSKHFKKLKKNLKKKFEKKILKFFFWSVLAEGY